MSKPLKKIHIVSKKDTATTFCGKWKKEIEINIDSKNAHVVKEEYLCKKCLRKWSKPWKATNKNRR